MPSSPSISAPQRDIFSVSRLNSEVRAVLNASFPLLWVEGEISNLARPSSGHIYFSLKDPHSQVRCAMFRMKRQRLRFEPENGMQVLVRASPNLYEARGDFQLSIEHMEPGGEGLLRQAFEELKQRLDQEGLFDPGQKQPLPQFPRQIGVITSPSGAAVRDVISVLKRRLPAIPVVIYPVQVQGDRSAVDINQAVQLANRRSECDLLILTRGGGSLEDLMAFNDEQVARAIAASEIPIISAIGHEIDFTIADFVADQRAPTPSAAAELATPDRRELSEKISGLYRHLYSQVTRQQQTQGVGINNLQQRLRLLHPGVQLGQRQQRVDELEQRLGLALQTQMLQSQQQLSNLDARLRFQSPGKQIALLRQKSEELTRRIQFAVSNLRRVQKQRLAAAIGNMNALSPLATLERGYSITTRVSDGAILDDAADISVGDHIETKLARGTIRSLVESSEES
ncbi:MAG: exodeoxyribonuclease VII large subunit [Gammaproteobacteria bacterium]|nr:exodeoxyribonuclease VII large subunit [Gammaproteobacteria bacterium]